MLLPLLSVKIHSFYLLPEDWFLGEVCSLEDGGKRRGCCSSSSCSFFRFLYGDCFRDLRYGYYYYYSGVGRAFIFFRQEKEARRSWDWRKIRDWCPPPLPPHNNKQETWVVMGTVHHHHQIAPHHLLHSWSSIKPSSLSLQLSSQLFCCCYSVVYIFGGGGSTWELPPKFEPSFSPEDCSLL